MTANGAGGLHGGSSGSGVNSQRLPSLVTAISLASGGISGMGGGVVSPSSCAYAIGAIFKITTTIGIWRIIMQSSEGRGNAAAALPPDADTLTFGDSALSAAQIFEDAHPSHLVGSQHPNGAANSSGVSSLMVDDMFLSLESAFSDDFEKMKRIANEVQQFCSPTPIRIISTAAATTTTNVAITTNTNAALHIQSQQQQQQRVLHTQQQQTASGKSTMVTNSSSSSGSGSSTTKVTKKYKRSTSSTQHHNNNNNNPNVTNHNSSTGGSSSSNTPAVGSGSTTNGGPNGPASGGSSSSTSSNSPTHCNGQRKERSLHYCSICSKGFKDKYSVNVHIRTHTGEKPFTCSLCGKSFRQKAHLAKHYQHTWRRSTMVGCCAGSVVAAAVHQRQLNVATSLGLTASARAVAGGVVSSVTVGGPLSGPTLGAVNANVLPPANGLLANR
ncbi:unnamed protein product [Ceratitis capitata]|uniref:(Mediterranean fruit fly) hypothetical protein n=1 Tax=Ceratitis capitata TaxID=7213 RepID=A0A811TZQ2_CERCA|nr:unnamed protein product [Ceratitis capitata]